MTDRATADLEWIAQLLEFLADAVRVWLADAQVQQCEASDTPPRLGMILVDRPNVLGRPPNVAGGSVLCAGSSFLSTQRAATRAAIASPQPGFWRFQGCGASHGVHPLLTSKATMHDDNTTTNDDCPDTRPGGMFNSFPQCSVESTDAGEAVQQDVGALTCRLSPSPPKDTMNVCGWAAVLWSRLQRLRDAAEQVDPPRRLVGAEREATLRTFAGRVE